MVLNPPARVIAPLSPQGLHVTKNQYLQLISYCSVASVPLQITYRIERADIDIPALVTNTDHTTNSSVRTSKITQYQLEEGYLTGVSIGTNGTAVTRGQCWCEVLLRDDNTASPKFFKLFAGYLMFRKDLGWTAGQPAQVDDPLEGAGHIYTVTVSNPAAGADWSKTVPTNARWLIRGGSAVFTASGNAANRFPGVEITDSTPNLIFAGLWNTAVTAGQVRNCIYTDAAEFASAVNTAGDANADTLLPVPKNLILPAGDIIASLTNGINATDQYSSIFLLVEEWLEIAS